MNNKYAITQWCLPANGLYSLRLAHQLGLDGIQLDLGSFENGYELSYKYLQNAFLEDAKRYNIEFPSIALNDLCSHGFTTNEERRKIAFLTIKTGVQVASEMGITSLTLPSFFDNELSDDIAFEHTVDACRYGCKLAIDQQIDLYTENCLLPQQLKHLFCAVGYPNFRVLFDSQNYHFFKGYNPSDILSEVCSNIGNQIHVKDGTGDLSNLPIGSGSSSFYETMHTLKKIKFQGWITLENNYKKPFSPGTCVYNPLEAIEKDIITLRTALNDL